MAKRGARKGATASSKNNPAPRIARYEPDALPQGWALARLGDVVRLSPEKIEPSETPDARYVGLEHIQSGTGGILGWGKASDVKSTKSVFRTGDILYGKLRPYLNKVARPDFGGVCSTDVLVLRCESGIEPFLITRLISAPRFVEFAMSHAAGINLPRASFTKLADYSVATPPSAEQQRIAERLNRLEVRLRNARIALTDIPTLLSQARQTLLAAACRGDLTIRWRKKHAPNKTGADLLDRIRTEHQKFWEKAQLEAMRRAGKAPKDDSWKARYEAPEPVNYETLPELPITWAWGSGAELVAPGAEIVYGIVQPGPKLAKGVLYVRGKDIENGRILVDQLMRTSKAIAARYTRSSLAPGDVLLGIIRATKVAVVPKELDGGNITQGTARFRPSSAICSGYLARALEAPETQSWLHAHYRGIDMPGLNLADVRRVPLPLPPMEEQREIVRRLNAAFAQLDAAVAAHADAVTQLDQLEQSLLAKAFRGGLVPQDPDDEPADELLTRIRAEREAAATAPRPAKSKATTPPKPVMPLLDLIQERFGKKPFTFTDLRAAADGRPYDELKQTLFALLRPAGGADPALTVRFNDKAEAMEFTLHKP